MADLDLPWGGDFALAPDGDLLLVDGQDLTRQRIERRLFTVAGGYIWHVGYGAGLPRRIGRPALVANIRALVRAQVGLEATVAQIPPPVIRVAESDALAGLFVIDIEYRDAITGDAVAISLQVPGRE